VSAIYLRAFRHGRELWRIWRTLGRHGVELPLAEAGAPPALVWIANLTRGRMRPQMCGKRAGERLADALAALGPSFVKLGQMLSVRPDVVGVEIAADLGRLRDRIEPFPGVEAVAVVEAALGRSLSEVFGSFDAAPVAAASIAQVHFAETPDGRAVAVKVLRPGVEAAFRRDLRLFAWIADLVDRFVPEAKRLRPVAVVETLARSVALELDLRFEAAAAAELAEIFAADPRYRVPPIDWERTGQRVLTLGRVDGIPIDDVAAIEAAGHDRAALAVAVIQSFLVQALSHGFFHADPHQGNLFVAPDGALVAVDFGIMGRLDRRTRLFMADMLGAFLRGDWSRAAAVHFEAGYVPADRSVEDFALACRAIGQPILDRPATEVSIGRLLSQLFLITETFGMRTQPHLLLLQKTMVTVEGVARALDPAVDFWAAARPVVETWARDNLGPEARVVDWVGDAARALARLPELLDRPPLVVAPVVAMPAWAGWVIAVLAALVVVAALT